MKRLALAAIRWYQTTPISRAGLCRFEPSCSRYTYAAIDRHGVFKGVLLGCWRIVRCNPFCRGGRDDVPEHFGFCRHHDHGSNVNP